MDRQTYQKIENYMQACMDDSAHNREHVYRVLYAALDIAGQEEQVDLDVLIAACLLHDIGRREQAEDSKVCHAKAGAKKAYKFLIENGFSEDFSRHVKACIKTHRFRSKKPPKTMEAKILFDADKLDAAGAMGIARTLMYQGQMDEPLYRLAEDGQVSDGSADVEESFFREYKYKLEGLYGKFYTRRGMELAAGRRGAAAAFYEALLSEARDTVEGGSEILRQCLDGQPSYWRHCKTEEEKPLDTKEARERMDSGRLYDPGDEEILREQAACMELLYDFNQTRPGEVEWRKELMEQMFAEIGENCYVEPPLRSNFGGKHVHLGNNVYANFNLTLVDDADIYIGDFCMFGPNVTVATAGHPIDGKLRRRGLQFNMPVRIGRNVWVGAGAVILPGVTIGDDVVIGAGSIVTKDIPSGVVAVGNPCRVLREIGEHDREFYYKDRKVDL